MKKEKIFMVEIAGSGGIAHYTYNLLKHYPDPSRIILYTGTPYEFKDKASNLAIKLIFNRLKTNPWKVFDFFYDVVTTGPLCVHFQVSQYPSFILCLMLILKIFSVKVVLTVHNVISHEPKLLSKYMLKRLYRYSNQIIVHSYFSRDQLISIFGIEKNKITKINHGNYGFLLDSYHTGYRPPNEMFTILFFGYIREYKGLDVLLNAVSLPILRNKIFRLVIAGKPVEPFMRYNNMIKELNLKDKVIKYLDYVPFEDVKSLFYDASVVVLPYRHIDQSGVLHLAYAFSRPVIASAVGGFPEVIENGYSGYLVPPEDTEALAGAINKLITDHNRVEILGKNAFELSKSKFSWEQIGLRTQKFYFNVCN